MTISGSGPFPDSFELRPAATIDEIAAAEDAVGLRFPPEYRDFLARADGGEGPLGEASYLILWSTTEIAEHNLGYKADPDYAKGLLLIGTDGGNEVYAIRSADGAYVAAPLIGMEEEAIEPRGSSLEEFVSSFD